MNAMVLHKTVLLSSNPHPLKPEEVAVPNPGPDEVLIKVSVCGVCHTEIDEIEGRTPPPRLPIILGHQVVGNIQKSGRNVSGFKTGQRVGVAWIYTACGKCSFCISGKENLCNEFKATGRDIPGGYAEYMVASASHIYDIPDYFSDAEAAPMLCAGAIGYRSMILANPKSGQNIGLTGFGASAHLVLKLVKHLYPDTRIYVFARSRDEREFAKKLGACWAGNTMEKAPEKLHSIIDTTPVWKTVVEALDNLARGGRLVINAIRKEETDKNYLLNLSYEKHLWMEKEIKSVANVTANDVKQFLSLAAKAHIKPNYQEYLLEDANRALVELKMGNIRGAKVLRIGNNLS